MATKRTPEEAAFLAAIRANRDDELVRLVYADWLDERNDPRGEYLRLNVELRRLVRGKLALNPLEVGRHLEFEVTFEVEWVACINGVKYQRDTFIYPWFWLLMESIGHRRQVLRNCLEAFSEAQLARYIDEFCGAKDNINPAYAEQFWPYLVGGCSADHADDFAAWAVMEGRDYYGLVISRPELINQHLPMYDEALEAWRRSMRLKRSKRTKRKRKVVVNASDEEIDLMLRGDYLAKEVYETRFGRLY